MIRDRAEKVSVVVFITLSAPINSFIAKCSSLAADPTSTTTNSVASTFHTCRRLLRTERSVYCLRHTVICMRIILSHGKVNIFNLAKNAGTSVEQIERFYAKHLPLSREMAKNLQSFGEQ